MSWSLQLLLNWETKLRGSMGWVNRDSCLAATGIWGNQRVFFALETSVYLRGQNVAVCAWDLLLVVAWCLLCRFTQSWKVWWTNLQRKLREALCQGEDLEIFKTPFLQLHCYQENVPKTSSNHEPQQQQQPQQQRHINQRQQHVSWQPNSTLFRSWSSSSLTFIKVVQG